MKAAVYHSYGPPDVIQIQEVPKPVPNDEDVLIKIRAASVNPADWHFLRGVPYFLRLMTGLGKPKHPRMGADVAGEVEAVGRNVTKFQPGDAVFGVCRGAFAEYACAPASKVARKPEAVTFEEAASVAVAAMTALQGLRDKGHLQPAQKVLINGAAGGVGTFAVQLAKSFGADVTGVCSTRNVEMVRSVGADQVIDYTREDFTRRGQRYDVMLDCIGNHPLAACKRILNPKGIYVGAGGPTGRWMIGAIAHSIATQLLSRFASQKVKMVLAKVTPADLEVMSRLMQSGKVKPVIDRRYPLREVPEAIRYLEQGHARGKVIITLDSGDKS